jgi:hypothetical protein
MFNYPRVAKPRCSDGQRVVGSNKRWVERLSPDFSSEEPSRQLARMELEASSSLHGLKQGVVYNGPWAISSAALRQSLLQN